MTKVENDVKEKYSNLREEKSKEIVKRTTPSLEERGITQKEVMQKAQRVDNDEFYTSVLS